MGLCMRLRVLDCHHIAIVLGQFTFDIPASKQNLVVLMTRLVLKHDLLFYMVDPLKPLVQHLNLRFLKEVWLNIVQLILLNFAHFSNKHVLILKFAKRRSWHDFDLACETRSKSSCRTHSSLRVPNNDVRPRVKLLIVNNLPLLKRSNIQEQDPIDLLLADYSGKRGDVPHCGSFFNESIPDVVS